MDFVKSSTSACMTSIYFVPIVGMVVGSVFTGSFLAILVKDYFFPTSINISDETIRRICQLFKNATKV